MMTESKINKMMRNLDWWSNRESFSDEYDRYNDISTAEAHYIQRIEQCGKLVEGDGFDRPYDFDSEWGNAPQKPNERERDNSRAVNRRIEQKNLLAGRVRRQKCFYRKKLFLQPAIDARIYRREHRRLTEEGNSRREREREENERLRLYGRHPTATPNPDPPTLKPGDTFIVKCHDGDRSFVCQSPRIDGVDGGIYVSTYNTDKAGIFLMVRLGYCWLS